MRINSTAFVTAAVSAAAALLLSCGGREPVTPGGGTPFCEAASSVCGQHLLWGFWEISVDPASQGAHVTPLRGVMFNANVVRFLQPPASPIHLLTVTVNSGSDFTTGHLDLDITLRHPFPGLKKYRGFDVRGIVMGEGSVPFSFDPTAVRAGAYDLILENADGWTRWWNPVEFTTYGTILGYTKGAKAPSGYLASATINPYKYFADGLDKKAHLGYLDVTRRGTFATDPGINTRNYILQFPAGPGGVSYKFNYAVDASWALPDPSFEPEYPVEAFPPEANTPEAWRVVIDDSASTAWYVSETAHGGSINLLLEIFDWQGSTQPSGVEAEVAAIWAESSLFKQPMNLQPIATVSQGGPVSSIWTAEITDLNLTAPGTFECWIAVEADNPANYAPQIQGDPYAFDWPDVPIRSYWKGYLHVSPNFPSPPPEVVSVIPPSGIVSTVLSDVHIQGANFQDGLIVHFVHDSGAELCASNVLVVDPTLITCELDCSGPLGFYNVIVINPDSQQGTLGNGFEVVPAPPTDSVWWQSHMYNIKNYGRNPTVDGFNPESLKPLWSSPVGGDKKYCTPVIADDKIFFTGNPGFYSTTEETVYCFDLHTGAKLWSKPINPSGAFHRAFACPVWWQGPDGIDRVAVGGDMVYCFNADTGEGLWTFDADIDGISVSFVSAQMQEYNGMVLARARQPRLYVLDFLTGNLISTVVTSSSSEGGCGAKDGRVYISSAQYLDCADILTGQILWSTHLPNYAEITHWINPTLFNDRCYVSTYQGWVFCVATEDDGVHSPGEVIWSWSDPAVPSGNNPLVGGTCVVEINGKTRIFVAAAFGGNHVYCIQDEGNKAVTLWQSDTTGYFDASPVWVPAPSYPEGVVYCPNLAGYIEAFDASNGHNVWHYQTGTELRSGVSVAFDKLAVTSGSDVSVFSP